jgi:ATP-binding cassette, subfamily B, multidrug efflux pump
MTSSARIFNLMDVQEITPEPICSVMIPENAEGRIEFESVWFAYNPMEPVLRGLTLSVKPGERVAIVGMTGAGKTTILNLLCRFYEASQGVIRLDGIPLADYPIARLRSRIAFVHQDVFLFAGSILDNIRLWNEDISEAEVAEAARLVNLDGFVESLPLKYHEQVIEGGRNFSAGQKQLISFARALVGRPAILVLDEATSNIDSITEKLVQDAVQIMMSRQTSVIVAHRLSTIRSVDRILVIHKGQMVEEGSHQELLALNGIYSHLHRLQFEAAAEPAPSSAGSADLDQMVEDSIG